VVAASLHILGGQGVQAALLIDGLARDGWQARLLPIDVRLPPGARWLRWLPYVRTVVNQALYLPSLLRLARTDVVHVFSASYWSFLLAPVPAMLVGRLCGKRVILNYHSGEASDHLQHWGGLVHPWLKLAHEIVVPSPYLRDVFAEHGYTARVVPNIVDLSHFRFRERRGLKPQLLSIRNLEPYYRVDVILRALALVRRRRPDARLTVAGYGSEERRLRELADALHIADAVRFVGRTEPDRVPALFDEHDLFVNASELDNQPVSILEAFAAGAPVVTTGAGDIPAMVAHGERGRLVPTDDPAGLANAVLELLADEPAALQLARAARDAIDAFTWPAVRDEWRDVYAPRATRSVRLQADLRPSG
jgi:glycosyltransferase involved in cell wall biosynthesis